MDRTSTKHGPILDELAQGTSLARFPAGRTALLECARGAGAPDRVLRTLERLPPGRAYENVEEVCREVGGDEERRF